MVDQTIPWRRMFATEPVMTLITLWLIAGSIAVFQAPYPYNLLLVSLGVFSVLGTVLGPNYLVYVHSRFINDLRLGLLDYTEELQQNTPAVKKMLTELESYTPTWVMPTAREIGKAHSVAAVVGLISFFLPTLLIPVFVVMAFNSYLDSRSQFLSHRLNWIAVLCATYYAIVSGDTLFHFYVGAACYGFIAGVHWLSTKSVGGGDALLLVAVGLTLAEQQIPIYLIVVGGLACLCFLFLRIIPLRRFKDLPPLAFGPSITGAFAISHVLTRYMG